MATPSPLSAPRRRVTVVQTPPELNLAQQEVVALLGASESERPSFDTDVAPSLRRELERGLAPVVAALPDDEDLWVKKFDLSAIHGCEVKYLADREVAFEWSIPKARGTIVHKAIQVGASWKGQLNPAELVEEAIARATQGTDSLGEWLRTRGDFDRADLASQVTERVTSFFECFPPLKASWRPNLEFSIRAELFNRRIVLIGKPDLSLGVAREPPRARSSSTSRPAASPPPTSTTCASTPCSTRSRSARRPGWWPATTSTPAALRPSQSPRRSWMLR